MVSVVIASFGRFQRLMACVESVQRSEPQPEGGLEVIVVTSTYAPAELATTETAGATVLRLTHRTFVSEAHNLGAVQASGEYLLFLDDDNVVAPDAIWRLALALQSADAVLIGPVMYYGHAPNRIWCAGVERSRLLMKTTLRSRLPVPIPDRIESEDFPNCFIVRRADFDRVGGFDALRFPQHMAEGDFARRLVQATGKQVYCVPTAKVWHFIGSSFLRRLHVQDKERSYWVSRSRTVYTAMYGTRIQWFVYVTLGQWVLAGVYVWAMLVQSSGDRIGLIGAYMRGLASGLWLGFKFRRESRGLISRPVH